jgi:serine/threonine-protein kinase RsbW
MDLRTSTRFRREPVVVPSARAFVGHALRSAGVNGDVAERLVLAVAEACNNAIMHAGGDTFSVTVSVSGTTCTLTITDAGQGFHPPRHVTMPAPEAVGHRGLALMEALVDHVKVTSSPVGTTVVLVQGASAQPSLAVDR